MDNNPIGDEGVRFFTKNPFPFEKLEYLILPSVGNISEANREAIMNSQNFQLTPPLGSEERRFRINRPQLVEEKSDPEKEKKDKL